LARRLLFSARMRTLAIFLSAFVVAFGVPVTAQAVSVLFDFNSLADGAGNSSVQSYMQNRLNSSPLAGMTVTVTGAVAEKDYTGDNHVVGPRINGAVKPITLGSSDGAVGNNTDLPNLNSSYNIVWDTYIHNASNTDRIVMTFSRPISWVSFDWEILPDGTCPNGTVSSCDTHADAAWPDFSFEANDVLLKHFFGVLPGEVGLTGTTYYRSQSDNPERAPQAIGTTGHIDLYITGSTTKLEFIDWPRMIAIDNLLIAVPLPATTVLVGAGAIVLAILRRRERD
jgi:hypothetical protein